MKNTGIVRRIDEVGRIVIPTEIRRSMGIKDGAEMEIHLSDDGDIVLTPVAPTDVAAHIAWLMTNVETASDISPLIKRDLLATLEIIRASMVDAEAPNE